MTACERTWEVEAVRDGRLVGEECARVERHVAACADCRRAREAMERVGQVLRDAPVTGADEVSVRRRRQRILALAHAEHVAEPSAPRIGFLALVGAGAAVLALVVWRPFGHDEPPGPVAAPAASVRRQLARVTAAGDAMFVRRVLPGVELIELSRGSISLDVARGPTDPRVLVRTPDAEIEDVGTVFGVTVRDARTTLVEVREGAVDVRLGGGGAHRVSAGERYEPYALAAAPTTVPLPSAAPPEPPSAIVPRSRAARVRAPTEVAEPASDPSAEERFARAVAEFENGEPSRAAELLAAFCSAHPSDVRTEDAAYLRILALARAGRGADAKAAARAYLERFPEGFRAPEARRLLE